MIRVSRARQRLDDDERVERFVGSMLLFGVLLVAAGVLYVGWVLLGGGFSAMMLQLTGGVPAYGERLLGLWLEDPEVLTQPPFSLWPT